MVKELMFEGSNRSFDQSRCLGLEITEADIDALCKAMKAQAIKNAHSDEQKAMAKDVGRQQLISWGVIIEREGMVYPSNAYAILTGCGAIPVAMQCGVFKGTTKEIFVDRREYEGPIWEQIEEAHQYVLRNIHMGAVFQGIYRQDVYEIPPDAIRELIINAAVHRSYMLLQNSQRCAGTRIFLHEPDRALGKRDTAYHPKDPESWIAGDEVHWRRCRPKNWNLSRSE